MYLSGVCSHCKDASLGVFLSHWVKAANLSTSNLSFCFYLLFWRCFLCTEETWSHQNWHNSCHKICCQMPIVWILLICILKTSITLQPFHCTKISLFHVFFSSLGYFKLIAFCVEKSVLRQVASAVLKRWRFPSAVFSEMLLRKTLNLWPLVFLQHMQHLHRLFDLHPAIMKALEHILCVFCWYFVFCFFACHFMQCIGSGMDLNFDSQSNFINIR